MHSLGYKVIRSGRWYDEFISEPVVAVGCRAVTVAADNDRLVYEVPETDIVSSDFERWLEKKYGAVIREGVKEGAPWYSLPRQVSDSAFV